MKIKSINIAGFKRFHHLRIENIPASARLVVLAGPNGSGKSSVFDAFKVWYEINGGSGSGRDPHYHFKVGLPQRDWGALVVMQFHDSVPTDVEGQKKMIYIRSAYRNEADFTLSGLQRTSSGLDAPKVARLIDNDTNVADNYQRLVSSSVEALYSGDFDSSTVSALKDSFIGQIRTSMSSVFGDLVLQGPGDPLRDGSFFFEKGSSKNFHYKNLSGGEKAAFNLLLDVIIKRPYYDNTIYCIDEPETHMNTRLQARLLRELISLIPDACQLWIASHSIGMMREARDLQSKEPGDIVFLDFHNRDFDTPIEMEPAIVNRTFWSQILDVALDDMATLVAPKQVVLCEGRAGGAGDAKAEFDAKCYRTIFADEFPDTDFLSVGNASDVASDKLEVGRAIQTLVSGTKVIRLVDQDDRSPAEIKDLKAAGVQVLGRRHIEAYLMDDEILELLCAANGKPEKTLDAIKIKNAAITDSIARGNPADDIKSAAGTVYVELKRLLDLRQRGSEVRAFMRDTLAPLIRPGTKTYAELRYDVFKI